MHSNHAPASVTSEESNQYERTSLLSNLFFYSPWPRSDQAIESQGNVRKTDSTKSPFPIRPKLQLQLQLQPKLQPKPNPKPNPKPKASLNHSMHRHRTLTPLSPPLFLCKAKKAKGQGLLMGRKGGEAGRTKFTANASLSLLLLERRKDISP